MPASRSPGRTFSGTIRIVHSFAIPAAIICSIASAGALLPSFAEVQKVNQRFLAAETAAYFMVAETLTNVVKHAEANRVQVSVVLREGRCIIEVQTTAWAAPLRTVGRI